MNSVGGGDSKAMTMVPSADGLRSPLPPSPGEDLTPAAAIPPPPPPPPPPKGFAIVLLGFPPRLPSPLNEEPPKRPEGPDNSSLTSEEREKKKKKSMLNILL